MDKIVSTIVHVLEQHADEYTDVQAAQAIADALNKTFRQQIERELFNYSEVIEGELVVSVFHISKVCKLDSNEEENKNFNLKGINYCHKHGGCGFISDCIECAKECTEE